MDYRELGRTGTPVSAVSLGTMTFGQQNSEEEGHAQMDYALGRGITMFDASELYPIPPKPETQGRTEAIIGTWLASRKARDRVMIATKAIGRSKMNWLRQDGSPGRQSRAQLIEALDGSLRRLKTDYVDLYQLHWPDRPMRIFEGLAMCTRRATAMRSRSFSACSASSWSKVRSGSSASQTRRHGA
jgi:aryl-alcohol dehydrogenase-like predicted oxidoreductase